MVKKEVEKKSMTRKEMDQALLDNFVNLQKVLTNMTGKFEQLSNNLSKLLQLFELSAKSFAGKPDKVSGVDEDFLKKLDSLLEQNKLISKGITMMEERVRGRTAMPSRPLRPTFEQPRMSGFKKSFQR
jgi:predicted RNase H-like nuclease (RuvC/YqgF family)